MSATVKLFVITRFNVYFSEANFAKDKAGKLTRTDEWLQRRFELFEEFCLPSLKVQTDQNFEWLILFSETTPSLFKDRIFSWANEFPNLKPIFMYDGENIKKRVIKEIKTRCGSSETHVITARLDNDDAYHRSMIDRIRAEFTGQTNEFLNFPIGAQMDIEQGIMTRVEKMSNPFMARVEQLDSHLATVMDGNHKDVESLGVIRNIYSSPAWLQIIHQGNQVNRLNTDDLLLELDLLAEFGIIRRFPLVRSKVLGIMIKNLLYVRPRRFAGRLKRSLLG